VSWKILPRLALVLLWAVPASAATLTFELDVEFSGGFDPQGPTPWLSITLDDSVGGANDVRITIDAANLVGAEFASGVYLNFDPALDPTLLSFSAVDNSDSVPVISTGLDAFKADGDGFFDILFDFPPPPGSFAAKFTSGESVVYDATYTAPIDVSSFDFESVLGGGNGSFLAAAHIQGINGNDEDSGWVGVPEPGLGVLLLPGLLGLMRRR
jgi:hypothetical protein